MNEADRAVLILRGYCPECFAAPESKAENHYYECSVRQDQITENMNKLLNLTNPVNNLLVNKNNDTL